MDFPHAIGNLARKSVLRLSAGQRAGERFSRALGAVRSFQVTWNLPEGASLDIEPFAGVGDSGVLDADLGELFLELGELARGRDRGVLFTIDEMQYLSREQLAALVQGIHLVAQHRVPVILVGAGLPSLVGLIGEARSYAERLFNFSTIDSLPDEAATAAFEMPARDEGVSWDAEATRRAIELTRGYPYFVQEFGKQACDLAAGPNSISLRDVEEASPIAIAELDSGFFRVRVDRTTDAERLYLQAMAQMGSGPHRSGLASADLLRRSDRIVDPGFSRHRVGCVPPPASRSPAVDSAAAVTAEDRARLWRPLGSCRARMGRVLGVGRCRVCGHGCSA